MTIDITPRGGGKYARPAAQRATRWQGPTHFRAADGGPRVGAPATRGETSGAGSALRAFLSVAARRPGTVGAVWPSSAALADLLASVVPPNGHPVVVELGPGTGAVSAQIARRLSAGGRHLAVEVDPLMARSLAQRLPGLEVINADASLMQIPLSARGVHRADVVVSGLPWGLFSPVTQRSIMNQVLSILSPQGSFTTFAYRHAAGLASSRTFRHLLEQTFTDVTISPVVWRNFPPAFTYICRKPTLARCGRETSESAHA